MLTLETLVPSAPRGRFSGINRTYTLEEVHRLRGSLPKLGIRPTIDGRLGGVRESLTALRPDVSYRAFDLMEADPARLGEILRWLVADLEAGRLRPLPHTSFPVSRGTPEPS